MSKMSSARVKKVKRTPPLIPCGWDACIDNFKNALELNAHIENHIAEMEVIENDVYICPWRNCAFHTEDLVELQRHVYYHGYYSGLLVQGQFECENEPDVPSCTVAEKEFDKVPDLKDDFLCEWTDCMRKFVSIVEFQDHLVQHANFEFLIQKSPDEPRSKLQCNWGCCKKQMENKYRLIEHLQTHTNKKAAACSRCGELFRTKHTLFDHLRRQSENNTQKYQCTRCFKFFATEKLLRLHVVKHVNCFKCSMCDMSCSSVSALATHVRYRHLKDKPFRCSECEHRCVRESDLVKHVNFVHKKQMHHCNHPGCNYTVRSYNLMRRHFLEVHENNPFIYVCHCCDKAFKNGKSLSSHLIKKHGFQLPSGHMRFTYRADENGFYRLETMRIESLEVTQQILSPNPFEVSDVTQDSSCYEIVSLANKEDERIIVSNDPEEAHLVGEVIISLPTVSGTQN